MNKSIPKAFTLLPFFLLVVAFNISSVHSYAQTIEFGKSYINITKGLNGGTVETGDTLEIRASFVVRAGTYDSCRYQDLIPTGTSFIPGTIRVLTNEGKIYKQFADAYGDDPGWITGINLTIHLGYNTAAAPATAFRRGRVINTHKPNFGNTCIMIASFRVRVTAAIGTNISTGGGNMTYKNGAAAIQTFTFPGNIIRLYTNYSICSNTIGANAIGTESNGTFGSGKPRNRGASANVPAGYTYQVFTTNNPNDYNYGVANNTSTRTNYTTLNTWAKPDNSTPTHRVFSLWDIIGDHTGAASPTLGNPAADTVANSNAGYMLIINAAYRIDSAFQQTITGLCPNTYYELSCWMRNICSKCGTDSNGVNGSSGTAGYIPTGPGDTSGVKPNITFEIDGIDYYTTGNLQYTGLWEKKGFTFLTGPLQTSFTLKYFNNAPGGGGNDWALDDISVATCSPNMQYSIPVNPIVCDSNNITIRDTVRSFFNNYTYYKWQRSTNGGANWTDVTGPLGPAVPFWNGTAWEYVSSYTLPVSATQLVNNGNLYRLVVATTVGNLSSASCGFTDPSTYITLNVIDCGDILYTDLISFTGQITNDRSVLKWIVTGDEEKLKFDIEKSTDGINFFLVTTINSHHNYNPDQNSYIYIDPSVLSGKVFYRIKTRDDTGKYEYSKIIHLSPAKGNFSFISVINPFDNNLKFEISSNNTGIAEAELIDAFGKSVKRKIFNLSIGANSIVLDETGNLNTGLYFLKIHSAGNVIERKIVKQK
jgi:hypothetical protein